MFNYRFFIILNIFMIRLRNGSGRVGFYPPPTRPARGRQDNTWHAKACQGGREALHNGDYYNDYYNYVISRPVKAPKRTPPRRFLTYISPPFAMEAVREYGIVVSYD
jgi:hypothetical protein